MVINDFSPEHSPVYLLAGVLSSSLPVGIPLINKNNIFDVERIEIKAAAIIFNFKFCIRSFASLRTLYVL